MKTSIQLSQNDLPYINIMSQDDLPDFDVNDDLYE